MGQRVPPTCSGFAWELADNDSGERSVVSHMRKSAIPSYVSRTDEQRQGVSEGRNDREFAGVAKTSITDSRNQMLDNLGTGTVNRELGQVRLVARWKAFNISHQERG